MTLAAITMTAPEAASPVQMYRATYSPDDNKLRLYAASRLDPETYKKVHDAGFRWAPRQALFVAPAWTPGREDVLLSLAGEIEDEDSTLAERQEARAERFTGYSGNSVHPESWLKFPGRSSWRVRRKLHGRRGAVVLMATRRRISPGRFHRSLLPISMISSIKRPVFLLTVAVFMNRTQFWITVNGYAFLFRSSFRMGVTGLKYCA